MKCFNHNETDASATCPHCGKALCAPCGRRFAPISCEDCFLARNHEFSQQLYVRLGMSAAIFVAVVALLGQTETKPGETLGYLRAVLPGLLSAFTYWGWIFISERFPRLVVGSPAAWAFYFAIRLITAGCIGIIVGPYQIVRNVLSLRAAHRNREAARSAVS